MKILNETYQEEIGSTFVHDGNVYDINLLFKLSEHTVVTRFNVADLTWILDRSNFSSSDDEREDQADTQVPILVTDYENELVVLDGLHRLAKAEDQGMDKIDGKMISHEMLEKCRLDTNSDNIWYDRDRKSWYRLMRLSTPA